MSHPRNRGHRKVGPNGQAATADRRTGGIGAWLAGVALALCTTPAAAGEPQPPLPEIRIGAGMHVIVAEVADTPSSRAMGLMYREHLGLNRGMLFAFERSEVHCFWMKNTPTALSIAFIDQKGEIIDIQDMKPLSEDTHCPPRPVRFALEMAQGWFAGKGIRAGQKLRHEGLFGR